MAKSSFSPKNSTVGFSLFMYILLAECRQTNEQVRNNDSKNNTPYSTIGLSCLLTLLQNCLLYSHGCSQIFCFQIQRPAKNYLPHTCTRCTVWYYNGARDLNFNCWPAPLTNISRHITSPEHINGRSHITVNYYYNISIIHVLDQFSMKNPMGSSQVFTTSHLQTYFRL